MLRGKIHVEILKLSPHNARFSSQARVELYHKIALCEKKKRIYPLTFNVNGYRQILHNGISLAINSSVARFTNVLSTILHLDVFELNYALSFSLLEKENRTKCLTFNMQKASLAEIDYLSCHIRNRKSVLCF